MRRHLILPLLLGLSACGVDGPPVPPDGAAPVATPVASAAATGVSITMSGDARFGLVRQ